MFGVLSHSRKRHSLKLLLDSVILLNGQVIQVSELDLKMVRTDSSGKSIGAHPSTTDDHLYNQICPN